MSYYNARVPNRGRKPMFSTSGGRGASGPLPGDRDPMAGLIPTPLKTIAKIILPSDAAEIEVKDLECLGSYNWTEGASPTIIVPGSPPQWLDRRLPFQVQADTGFHFKNQNSQRCPNAPLLPLFVAVDQMTQGNKKLDWALIDFVTDRNNLRKLLRWAIGEEGLIEFRIDTQLAGKSTILLSRWENRDREELSGYTFGLNFEKESTRPAPGCECSTGHHRIVQYDMNGLNIIVRSKTDACLIPQTAPKTTRVQAKGKVSDDVDDIAAALAGVSIGPTSQPPADTKHKGGQLVSVIHAGSMVPQSSILEITTRSRRNAAMFNWKDAYPQLFLAQTPHHFLAIHERGRFVEVEKRYLQSSEVQKIAADSAIQDGLKKLRCVLDVIKELVMQHGEKGRLSLVCKNGVLAVYERISDDSCLPDEVFARFKA